MDQEGSDANQTLSVLRIYNGNSREAFNLRKQSCILVFNQNPSLSFCSFSRVTMNDDLVRMFELSIHETCVNALFLSIAQNY